MKSKLTDEQIADALDKEDGLFEFIEYMDGFDRVRVALEDLRALRSQVARLEEQIESAQDEIQGIINWTNAYPLDVFIEPEKEVWGRANKILEENGISFTALNGSTMRHVINGVAEYAKKAYAALSGKG